eukprot:1180165-Pleurochrysis_carterae.AAC.1
MGSQRICIYRSRRLRALKPQVYKVSKIRPKKPVTTKASCQMKSIVSARTDQSSMHDLSCCDADTR